MRISRKLYSVLSAVIAVLAALGLGAMLCVMMLGHYETDVHYFRHQTPLSPVLSALALSFVALVFLLALSQKKASLPAAMPTTTLRTIAGVLVAASLLYFAITDLRLVLSKEMWGIGGEHISGFALLFADRFNTVRSLSDLFAILSAVYFLLPVFLGDKKGSLRAVFGLAVVIFFIFRLLVLYYDISTPINSPVRMLDQMASVAAMLALVLELRFLLSDARPRLYVPVASVAFVLLFIHSVSQTVAFFALEGMKTDLAACVFELLLSIYLFVGLVGYLFLAPKKAKQSTPTVTAEQSAAHELE